jgi:hypothetical protein
VGGGAVGGGAEGSGGAGSGGDAAEGGGGGAPNVGCSDGEREAFTDTTTWPAIAACDGGWDVPGVRPPPSATCARSAGDDSGNPAGAGCSAEDLCALGWHLCTGAEDVVDSSPDACTGMGAEPDTFYATGQSSETGNPCTDGGRNDLWGCGTLGAEHDSCLPLTRASFDLCQALAPPWDCGQDGVNEATNLIKPGGGGGGVLCCAD